MMSQNGVPSLGISKWHGNLGFCGLSGPIRDIMPESVGGMAEFAGG